VQLDLLGPPERRPIASAFVPRGASKRHPQGCS
jgi:hypothetical protein